MNVAIIDAGVSNLASVRYAFERLEATVSFARAPSELANATHVVLPGVGAAGPAMRALQRAGFDRALRDWRKPLLGICLGMQLLYESSDEGDVACLGLLPGRVRALPRVAGARLPHMGWNAIARERDDPLFEGLPASAHAYFIHGFVAPVDQACVATAVHGAPFCAVVRQDRLCGTQFHPERSGAVGARLLRNFLRST